MINNPDNEVIYREVVILNDKRKLEINIQVDSTKTPGFSVKICHYESEVTLPCDIKEEYYF